MNLVIDANILFALLIRKGKTEDIFFNDTIKLYAPEFMLDEFEKYKD
jgi:predicted nucleic acid-binding protein